MPHDPLQITLADAVRIAGGRLAAPSPEATAAVPLGAISTDSRSLAAGDVFLALRGETHDGHRFLADAIGRGASALILAKDFRPPDGKIKAALAALPVLWVADTLAAYGELAAARRRAWGGPVLAVGGSVGKTTVRRLVAAALATRHAVLEPRANYNNLVGVPHTLLQLTAAHEIAVLELGMNQPGELTRLTAIATPSVALLTRIERAHIGMFPSMKALVAAKMDLFRGCAPGTPLVVNAGCGHTCRNLEPFRAAGHPITTFRVGQPARGAYGGDVRVAHVTPLEPAGYRFELQVRGEPIGPLELRLFGRHHLENVAAAAAMLLAAGHDPALIADALPTFQTAPLRGQVVVSGGVTWIMDCYNASPPAVQSALASLLEIPYSGRRILVLADMLELGHEATERHHMLIKPLIRLGRQGDVDFMALGPEMSRLAPELVAELEGVGGSSRAFATREELIETLREELASGDQVFLKGSHAFALEKVAGAIDPQVTEALSTH